MRIGILRLPRLQSGTDQLSSTITESLIGDTRHEFVIFNQDVHSEVYSRPNVTTVLVDAQLPIGAKVIRTIVGSLGMRFPFGMSRVIRAQNLDVLVTTSTASLAGVYAGVPYICYIADLMHRFYPDLPDFGFWEKRRRDLWYSRSARNSILCVVDSECGRMHVSESYGIDPKKIVAIGMVAPPYIYRHRNMPEHEVAAKLARFSMPRAFLLYPAQFWAHKNHLRLLAAVKMLRDSKRADVNIVLPGSAKTSHTEVLEYIEENKLGGQVSLLGYVSDEEMAALYLRCRALVFPSLFGPANIPIIEAFVMGKPVVCSRLFAMPEQVGDAGILFDPFSVEDMAEALYRIWSDENLVRELGARAVERAKQFTLEAYAGHWRDALEGALRALPQRP